jgi:outer membrane protein assembly factor BamB
LDGVRALYGDLALSEDGETVFVPSYGGWLFALDAQNGDLRWLVELDPMVGGVAAAGDVLYVGTKESNLFAVDSASGTVNGTVALDGEIWATPALVDDGASIVVPTLGKTVYRLNGDLDVEWQFDDAEGAFAATVTVADGLLFAGAYDSKLYALDVDTGEEQWAIEADNWFWSQPVVEGDTVYAASLDGKVYAADRETGEARWPEPFDTGSEVRSALTVSGGALIVGARNGLVHKLALDDGTPTGQPLQIGTKLESDLFAAEGDTVYAIPRQSELWVIDAAPDSLAARFFDLPD